MEEQNLNKFQQYIRQNPAVVGIFVFLQVIFIILIIVVVINTKTNTFQESNLSISNLEQDLQNLPTNSVDAIQTVLYDAIADNKGTLTNLKDSDAKVRKDTLINLYFEKQNMHYTSFIVDIPSIEQSYQIFHEWSDDNANPYYLTNHVTIAMCPKKEQTIYVDFQCHDRYSQNGQAFVVSEFLPYMNSSGYNTFIKYDRAPYTIIISPNTFNVDDNTKNTYIEQTKEKVASLGFPADIFSYYVSYGPEDPELFLEYIISNQ